jgi:C1A family cysteine protease
MTLPLSPAGRRYGFKPSPKDPRDFSAFRILAPIPIPPAIDLEAFCGPVKDQGQEGSCTAHAGTENLEYIFRKFKAQEPIFSPQFLYYCERDKDGTLSQGDCGSYGRTAVQVMQKFGCCLLSSDLYDPSHMNDAPTDAQWAEARLYLAGAYHALSTVDEMKHCIASGYPFLIGFDVYENFETDIGPSGVMPSPHGSILGGHEVLVIGYDDSTGYFKVRNSWSAGWGDHGNFYMSYNDVLKVISEAWIQHFGNPWK